jgi:hypothetical protein
MNPSWGDTLNLIQEHGSIRISSVDNVLFRKLLDSIGLKYTESGDGILTRFTLDKK